MNSRHRRQFNAIAAVLLVLGALMILALPAVSRANEQVADPAAAEHLENAWQRAADVAAYAYNADVLQTTYPTAQLENVGRDVTTQQMTIAGQVDRRANQMTLALQSGASAPLNVKVEDGIAYGRADETAEWQELTGVADIFAPGGDPLAFLVAVVNVREIAGDAGAGELFDGGMLPPAYAGEVKRLAFEIDGPTYAAYMRDLMEETLRESGELPPGIRLEMAGIYLDMTGQGELWLGPDGLPLRQIVHLEFPPEEGAGEWTAATITSDFSQWQLSPIGVAGQVQRRLLNGVGLTPDTALDLALNAGFMLIICGAVILFGYNQRSKKLRSALAFVLIFALVVPPLMQAQQVQAFQDTQLARSRAQAEEAGQAAQSQEIADAEATLTASDFNPLLNPRAKGPDNSSLAPQSAIPAALNGVPDSPPLLHIPETECAVLVAGDHDCDGNPDNDGDGLTDVAEAHELGTDPDEFDTDKDGISDLGEVAGFFVGGRQWYADPLRPDSNQDGLPDGLECPNLLDVNLDGTPGTASGTSCPDTDSDTVPDIFDFDNDGDGVPDSRDASPSFAHAMSLDGQSQVSFNMDVDETVERPLAVTFEIRPQSYEHLFKTNAIMNWPDDDMNGQILRVNDNTFADMGFTGSEMDQGDMMTVPMLEIVIPSPSSNTANPAGGLPIKSDFTGDVTGSPLADWLDTDALDQYGVSVSREPDSGDLYAYLPLTLITDDNGGAPVAWGTQMLYRPRNSVFGADHQIRLVWQVQALLDECDQSDRPDDTKPQEWCAADSDNWTTSATVIHAYYPDFHVTGMAVREDLEFEMAVVAQNDALSAPYESDLWHLANGLMGSFVEGEQIDDDNNGTGDRRFDINEVADVFGAGSGTLWDIPLNNLTVDYGSYSDQIAGMSALITDRIPTVLSDTFGTPAADSYVNLLVAREETYKSVALRDFAISGTGAGNDPYVLTPDTDATAWQTYATLNWSPFGFDGLSWASTDAVEQSERLQASLNSAISQAQIDELLGWFGESSSDPTSEKVGAIALARNFYLAMYLGQSQVVADEIDGLLNDTIYDPTANNMDFNGDGTLDEVALIHAAAALGLYQTLFEREEEPLVNEVRELLILFGLLEGGYLKIDDSDSTATLIRALGKGATGGIKKLIKLFWKVPNAVKYYQGRSYVTKLTMLIGVTSVAIGVYMGLTGSQSKALRRTLNTLSLISSFVDVFDTLYTIYTLSRGYGTALATFATLQKLRESTRLSAVIGFIGSVSVATILFILSSQGVNKGSLEYNLLLAHYIAELIVAVILLIIAATIIGAVILSIVGAIDAAIAFFCSYNGEKESEDVERWVCGGIIGAFTEAIVHLIYDMALVADLGGKNRLDIAFNTPVVGRGPTSDQDGFVVGNTLALRLYVTNTLKMGSPTGLGSSYADWGGDFFTNDKLKKSVFGYYLQDIATPHHNSLVPDSLPWPGLTEVFSTTETFQFQRAGINVPPEEMFMTESLNVPVLECWGFIYQKCKERTFKDSVHFVLSDKYRYDVFPSQFGNFVRLTSDDGVNFRTSWSGRFSTLQDADHDGLISQSFGGPDPNDGDPDTDGDGLTDFWEYENGTDLLLADGDLDGLNDYWEEFYDTNPYIADSDNDGLLDGEEFFHPEIGYPYENSTRSSGNTNWSGGWEIVYDNETDGSPLRTWVSADPLETDLDGDFINDFRERIYGYNPNVAEELNILSLDSRVQTPGSMPGTVIAGGPVGYTATVRNELDNRVINGLLEVEFPVDVVQASQVLGSIYPQLSADAEGSVTAPNVSESSEMTFTVRAGAVVDTSAVDEIFLLNFDEEAGSTVFYDATSRRLDFSCTVCPTVGTGYATFSGATYASAAHDPAFDQGAFTLETWIKPTASSSGRAKLFDDQNDIQLSLDRALHTLWVSVDGADVIQADTRVGGYGAFYVKQWHHVVVTYDGTTIRLYLNGVLLDAQPATITRDDLEVRIGEGYQGQMDSFSLRNVVMTDSEIAAQARSLALHFPLDAGTVGTTSVGGETFCDWLVEQVYELALLRCGPANASAGSNQAPIPATNGYNREGLVFTEAFLPEHSYADSFLSPLGGSVPLADSSGGFSTSVWMRRRATGGTHYNQGMLEIQSDSGDWLRTWVGTLELESVAGGTIQVVKDYQGMAFELGSCTGPSVDVLGNRLEVDDLLQPLFEWVHVAMTYDGAGTIRVYQNGNLVGEKGGCGAPDFGRISHFRLGQSTHGSKGNHNAFGGYIDDLRIYGKMLTADEVEELFRESSRTLELALDEAPGQDSFADSSVNDFTPECATISCPDTGLPGRYNQAARFDGVDDSIQAGNADTLGLSDNNFTVLAWVKGTGSVLGTEETATLEGLNLSVLNNRPLIEFSGGGLLHSSTVLDPAEWHHLAFRYTKDDNAGAFVGSQAIFIDGVLDSSNSGQSAFTGVGMVSVGRALGLYADGMIDHLIIVNQALTQSEIQAIMNEAPLVNLHLDEDLDTTTFADDTPFQNDATCSSCPTAGANGQMREAPLFTDAADSLSVNASSANLDGQQFSAALWVRPDQQTRAGFRYLMESEALEMKLANGGLVFVNLGGLNLSGGGPPCDAPTNNIMESDILPLNEWTHVVLTVDDQDRDPATATFEARLYINGVERDTVTIQPEGLCTELDNLSFGTNLEGSLDEITLYGRALAAGDVEALFDYQSAWYDTTLEHVIRIDAEAPVVTLDVFSALPLAPRLLPVRAIDVTSDVEEVLVDITAPDNSVTSQSATRDGDAWIISFNPIMAGTYIFDITAQDSVGNVGSLLGQAVLVDGTDPVLTINTPATIQPGLGDLSLDGTASDASAGIDAGSLTVDVLDWQGFSAFGISGAAFDGLNWTAAFSVSTPVYGEYQILAGGEDNAGNSGFVTDTVQLDGYGPTAGFYSPGPVLDTAGETLAGVFYETPYPAENQVLHMPFETQNGAQPFADTSPNAFLATCSACPATGGFGHGLTRSAHFDGIDDSLTIAANPLLELTDGVIMAWLVPTWTPGTLGYDPVFLVMEDGANTGYKLHIADDQQSLLVSNGTSTAGIAMDISAASDPWSHLAVTLEGDVWTAYLQGVPMGQATLAPGNLADLPLHVGAGDGSSDPFPGFIDDLAIYDLALEAETIYDLAHPLGTGGTSAYIRFRNLAEAALGVDDGVWNSVTPLYWGATGLWQTTLPAGLEGLYRLDAKATDITGNQGYTPAIWNGEIDTVAPRVTFSYVPGADYQTASVSCAAEDFNLVEDGWVCPVDDAHRSAGYQAAPWYTELFTDVLRLETLTTTAQIVPVVSGASMTACDAVGHCTTALPPFDILELDNPPANVPTNALTAFETTEFTGYDPAASYDITWHWGDGSNSAGTILTGAGVTISGEHTYTTSGFYTVFVEVVDLSDGSLAAFSVPVEVQANLLPELVLDALLVTVDEGQQAVNGGSFADPEGTQVTLSVSAGVIVDNLDGTWSWSFDSQDGPAESQTITIYGEDEDGGTGQASFDLVVNNVAPTASFSNTGPVDEGGSFTLLLDAAFDPSIIDSGSLEYAFDCGDGNGYSAYSTSNSVTCLTDDDGARSVHGIVRDKDGDSSEYGDTVTVQNVAPSATFNNDGPVDEGGSFTLSLDDVSDPSSVDTAAGFEYAFDCGDGSGYSAFSDDSSLSCPTDDNGPRNTFAIVRDVDGGQSEYSAVVIVNNVAPTLSNLAITSPISETLPATLTGDISDPGTQDSFVVQVDWGDGMTETVDYPAGSTSFALNHQYSDDDPSGTPSDVYPVALIVRDSDMGQDTAATTVTVQNVAPELADLAITPLITETQMVTLTGSIVELSPEDSFTLVVDWADGATNTVDFDAGTTAFMLNHTYQDDALEQLLAVNGVFSVTLSLSDDDGGLVEAALSVTVNNAPPTLTDVDISATVEGETAVLTGSINDGGRDSFNLLVDWGDGEQDNYDYPTGTTTFSVEHIYLDDNAADSYTVTLKLSDDDGGQNTTTVAATVVNSAPQLAAITTTPIFENGTTTLSGDIVEVSPLDSFTMTVDWGDGNVESFSYPAGTTSFSETHQYLNDDPSNTPSDEIPVQLTLHDDDGGEAIVASSVSVTNVAPTLSNLAITSPISETLPATLTGDISDPGTQDSFVVQVDWGDGMTETVDYPAGSTSFALNHQYSDDDPSGTPSDVYPVAVIVRDSDMGQDTAATTVTVQNVAPELADLAITPLITETQMVTLTGSIVELSPEDSFTLVVDWADGATNTVDFDAGTTAFMLNHTYQDDALEQLLAVNGVFSVTLSLSDDDGGLVEAALSVTVNNAPPALTDVDIAAIVEGETAVLTGSISESPGDSFSLSVDWGDGEQDNFDYPAGTIAFSVEHVYLDDNAADSYTVTLTLSDHEGGVAVYQTTAVVTNVAPEVEAGPDQRGDVGQLLFFNGAFTDVGILDTHTIAWEMGDGTVYTNTLTPSHSYSALGTYTVTLTVTDDDGGQTSVTIIVIIDTLHIYLPMIISSEP